MIKRLFMPFVALLLLTVAATGPARAQWTGGTYTATSTLTEDLGAVVVSSDATLTINPGVTVSVSEGLVISDGKTLTVTGGGTLLVTAPYADEEYGANGKTAVQGNIVIMGGTTVSAYGTQGNDGRDGYNANDCETGDNGQDGGDGGAAFSGNVTIYSGTIYAYGGDGVGGGDGHEGGSCDNGNDPGGNGGNGGNGGSSTAFTGTLTVYGGNVYAWGGNTGVGGGGGAGGHSDKGDGQPGTDGGNGVSHAYANSNNVHIIPASFTLLGGLNDQSTSAIGADEVDDDYRYVAITSEANDPVPPQTTQILIENVDGWDGGTDPLTAENLPSFQSVTLMAAQLWAGVPQSGTAWLFYTVSNGDYSYIIFTDGVQSGGINVFSGNLGDLYNQMAHNGVKIYYTVPSFTLTLASNEGGSVDISLASAHFAIPSEWNGQSDFFTSSDLQGFVPATLEEAKAWTGAPENGEAYLVYGFDAEGNAEFVMFYNGGFEFNDAYKFTHKNVYSSSMSIYYFALPAGVTATATPNVYNVAPGSEVTLTATPDATHYFVQWDNQSTTASRAITMGNANATYTATFADRPTLTLASNEGGSVDLDIATYTITCSGNGNTYTIPNYTGSRMNLDQYSILYALYGTYLMEPYENSDHIVFENNLVINGPFKGEETYTFIDIEGETPRPVTFTCTPVMPAGVTATATSNVYKVIPGTEVSVTATPMETHYLVQWNDQVATAARTITMGTDNADYTATFAHKPILTLAPAEHGAVALQTVPGSVVTTWEFDWFANNFGYDDPYYTYSERDTITHNGITLISVDDGNNARLGPNFYDYGYNTFTSQNGEPIVRLEMNCTYANGLPDGATYDGDKVVWTGEAQSVTFRSDIYDISQIVFTTLGNALPAGVTNYTTVKTACDTLRSSNHYNTTNFFWANSNFGLVDDGSFPEYTQRIIKRHYESGVIIDSVKIAYTGNTDGLRVNNAGARLNVGDGVITVTKVNYPFVSFSKEEGNVTFTEIKVYHHETLTNDTMYMADKGTEVTLVATPADGYHLAAWSNNAMVNPEGTQTVTMTRDSNITATFADNPVLTLGRTEGGSLDLQGVTYTITFSGNGNTYTIPDYDGSRMYINYEPILDALFDHNEMDVEDYGEHFAYDNNTGLYITAPFEGEEDLYFYSGDMRLVTVTCTRVLPAGVTNYIAMATASETLNYGNAYYTANFYWGEGGGSSVNTILSSGSTRFIKYEQGSTAFIDSVKLAYTGDISGMQVLPAGAITSASDGIFTITNVNGSQITLTKESGEAVEFTSVEVFYLYPELQEGKYKVAPGTYVGIVAKPDEEYHLVSWSNGAEVTLAGTQIVEVTRDTNIAATFTVNTYTLDSILPGWMVKIDGDTVALTASEQFPGLFKVELPFGHEAEIIPTDLHKPMVRNLEVILNMPSIVIDNTITVYYLQGDTWSEALARPENAGCALTVKNSKIRKDDAMLFLNHVPVNASDAIQANGEYELEEGN